MATCTATTRPEPCAGPCWGLAMDAPLRPGHHRLQLQLHANPTATPLPTSSHPLHQRAAPGPLSPAFPPLLPAPIFPLLPPAPSPAAPFSPSPHRLEGHTPSLRPLHSVPTPAEFNPDDDHYDTTRVAGYDLPKVITLTAFTRQLGIEGQDIARVSLLNFLHEQWNSWWLRHLAHGGEVRIVVAKSMPESVFAAGLLSQIRRRHLDLDALALHVATQEGTSTTKPAAMKLLTSKIFDFLISLRPTTTTDPASAATILQLHGVYF